MIVKVILVGVAAFAVLAGSVAGAAAGPDSSWVAGDWAVDGSCEGKDTEHVVLGDDGTVRSTMNGKVDAVGFWELEGDVVQLHLVSSPAFVAEFVDEKLPSEGGYYYFPIRIVVLNQTKNSFDAVGLLGQEFQTGKFTRCQ